MIELNNSEVISTPCYYYNLQLLENTLDRVGTLAKENRFIVHYAVKANANHRLLNIIASNGLGADCVSGNEVRIALDSGFDNQKIVFAGVGKTDGEIEFALDHKIFCFHCESVQELKIINHLAAKRGTTAAVALRLNPNVSAHTHAHITTGLIENKFGLSEDELVEAKNILPSLNNVELIGLHFHIGSQITDLDVFRRLALKINQLNNQYFSEFPFKYLNVGGGLGIDYHSPDQNPMPDFEGYFNTFRKYLKLNSHQMVHFELGRSIVGQCGYLITRVIYVKGTSDHRFVVVDAGMNDLLRPALYGAKHKIINISSTGITSKYDVVGPVCESADCFDKNVELPETQRGDLMAILSCGAYGEAMSSRYNLRDNPGIVFSDRGDERKTLNTGNQEVLTKEILT